MGLIIMTVFLGIPFYFIWNNLAPIYFTQLPALYQHFPFWHCIGFFALIAIVRAAIFGHHHHHAHHHWGRFNRWKEKHY